MNDFSGDSILNEWSETCAHHIGFYTIPCDYNTYYWWANPSVFEWLRQYKSLCMQGLWRLDLIEILPRFPYVCTDFCEHIYDTSINEVVDILHRNSPYYVVCTCTGILEPSLVEWMWDQVTMVCHCLLQRLVFSKSRDLAGISFPQIPTTDNLVSQFFNSFGKNVLNEYYRLSTLHAHSTGLPPQPPTQPQRSLPPKEPSHPLVRPHNSPPHPQNLTANIFSFWC